MTTNNNAIKYAHWYALSFFIRLPLILLPNVDARINQHIRRRTAEMTWGETATRKLKVKRQRDNKVAVSPVTVQNNGIQRLL